MRSCSSSRFTLFVLTFAAVLWGAVPAIAAGTRVVFTIDVESNDVPLPAQMNAVCEDGSHCGLMEIARILQARGWQGTFFLNVYEERRWGAEPLRSIARALQNGGHDVELHTHPQWAYDAQRWTMWSYSLDDQTRIIADGKRLLESWTGRPVVAHRAGGYTANDATIIALARNGIHVDSSYFWRDPDNRQTAPTLARNLPSSDGAVLELPVTVFLRHGRPGVLDGLFPPVTSVRKLDPNWLVDEHEMGAAIDGAIGARIPVIVVFLHSFSFIKETRGGTLIADRHALDLFQRLVDDVSRRMLPVTAMRELQAPDLHATQAADVVPEVPVDIGVPRYVWHVAKEGRRTAIAAAAAVIAALIALVALRGRGRWQPVPYETAAAQRQGGSV